MMRKSLPPYLRILLKHGLNSISFTNPLQALEHFVTNPDKFSLLITDMRMPGMCGLELASKIREINKSIKIFLITAFDTDELDSNKVYRTAKIDRITQKPVKLGVLRKLIQEIFNS